MKIMAKLLLCFSILAAIASANDFGPDALSSIGAKRTCISNPGAPDYNAERCFYTYIPTCAGVNAPLVFDIHGKGSSPQAIASYSGWTSLADENCFVVVLPSGNIVPPATRDSSASCFSLPSGLTKSNGVDAAPCCCTNESRHVSADLTLDTTFLEQVAETAIHDVPDETFGSVSIDRNRIYMSGHSIGCIASLSMAAEHSDLVAAVGCFSGVAQSPFPSSYQPTPTWVVHGTLDTLVPHDGRRKALSAMETYQAFADANGCTARTEYSIDNGGNPGTRYISDGCVDDATVELLSLQDVGHYTYESKNGKGEGTVPTKLDTVRMAWEFVSQYSLGRPPCRDSPLDMKQGGEWKDCAWASEYSSRCDNSNIRSHCPITCAEQNCFVDSTKNFKLAGNGQEKTCAWVTKSPAARCAKKGVKDTCRQTCELY